MTAVLFVFLFVACLACVAVGAVALGYRHRWLELREQFDALPCANLVSQLARLAPKDLVMSSSSGFGRIGLVNGSRIVARVPRRDGAGVKGLSPDIVAIYGPVDDRVENEVRGMIRGKPMTVLEVRR